MKIWGLKIIDELASISGNIVKATTVYHFGGLTILMMISRHRGFGTIPCSKNISSSVLKEPI